MRKLKFLGDRKLWKHKGLLNRQWIQCARYDGNPGDREEALDPAEATLVSSQVHGDFHMPVLDIDFEAALVASTTEGHYHLYLNKLMSWETYKGLLDALFACGVIEEGFYRMTLARGQSFVRYPGVKKQEGEEGSG